VLQHAGEVRDHENKGAYDKTEKHDILRHGRALLVAAAALQSLPQFCHERAPPRLFSARALIWRKPGSAIAEAFGG